MHTYDHVYTAINKMGFSEFEHAKCTQLGVVCYKNGYIHVVLQNWDHGMTIEAVESECQVIRSLLLNLGVNVWNAYYILCSNLDDIDDDLAFFIERNSVSLRKYVIRRDSDLNRIPFLDDIPVNEIDNPLLITEGLNESDSIISALLGEIKKLDGHTTSLNKKGIKNVVDFILSNEGKKV